MAASFTHEQKVSIYIDRHASVTANAGSGKTRVLVERYLNLLLNDPAVRQDPQRIVAITFTRKAAAEMKARIVREISDMMQSPEYSDLRAILPDVREKLSFAKISTIHSFCSSLLREFPIEAGVNPNFTDAPETDYAILKKNSVIDVLENMLASDDANIRKNVNFAIRRLTLKKVKDFLEEMLKDLETFHQIKKYYETFTDEEIFQRNLRLWFENIREMWLLEEIHLKMYGEYLDALLNFGEDKKKKKNEYYEVRESLNRLIATLEVWNGSYDNDLIDALLQEGDKLATLKAGRGFAVKQAGKDSGYDDVRHSDLLHKWIISLTEAVQKYSHLKREKELIRAGRILFEIAGKVVEDMDETKDIEGMLNFSDMLLKTDKLLDNPDVLRIFRRKVTRVLVDEFQDTNELQYSIIRKLVEDLNPMPAEAVPARPLPSTQLFIVGDAKQSIYRFRGADVRVFLQAIRDIMRINEGKIQKGELPDAINAITDTPYLLPNERKGKIELLETFRLQPVVASFCNVLFGNVMKSEYSEYETDYEPLIVGRSTELIDGLINDDSSPASLNSAFGSISFLMNAKSKNGSNGGDEIANGFDDGNGDDDEDKSTKGNKMLEATNLARKIKSMILGSGNANSDEPYNWSDVAVLSRTRKDVPYLAIALMLEKIPYTLHAGKGFYVSQEVLDVVSYLKFLQNPKNDVFLYALLKSPYFGLSDNDVFDINNLVIGGTLWERIVCLAEECEERFGDGKDFRGDLRLTIERTHRILSELLPLASRLPISQLIIRLIEETGWIGAITNNPAREQMSANVDKLIELARAFEARGFKNLYDFIAELDMLIEESSEGEAAFLTGENTINIMTIHSSKGLEFPIVAIYSMDVKAPPPSSFNVDDKFGLTFSIYDQSANELANTRFESIAYALAKQENEKAEYAELKRLLYVACTRAKDHLILSAKFGTDKKSGALTGASTGFLGLIAEGLHIDYTELFMRSEHLIQDTLIFFNGGTRVTKKIEYPVKIYALTEKSFDEALEVKQETEIDENVLINIDPLASDFSAEYFSATKLSLYKKDKEEFYKKYYLGLIEEDEKQAPNIEDNYEQKDTTSGAAFGIIVHAALETMNEWTDFSGIVLESELEKTIRALMEDNSISSESTYQESFNQLKGLIESDFISDNLFGLKNAFFEYELNMPINGDYLTGSIDCLIQNKDGMWEIWDWKTNRVDSIERINELRDYYSLQMKIYAYMLSLLYPDLRIYRARLIFTRLVSQNDESGIVTFEWSKEELEDFFEELRKSAELSKSVHLENGEDIRGLYIQS
ncbi:MAG: UvrD-helicase domain-containing protein [Chloroflexota bacterium]